MKKWKKENRGRKNGEGLMEKGHGLKSKGQKRESKWEERLKQVDKPKVNNATNKTGDDASCKITRNPGVLKLGGLIFPFFS